MRHSRNTNGCYTPTLCFGERLRSLEVSGIAERFFFGVLVSGLFSIGFPSFRSDVTISRFNLNNFISACLTILGLHRLLPPPPLCPVCPLTLWLNEAHKMRRRTHITRSSDGPDRAIKKAKSENCHGLSRNVSHWDR